MSEWDDPALARELRRSDDQRTGAIVRREMSRVARGIIGEQVDEQRASVHVGGNPIPSPGYRWSGRRPVPGEAVWVEIPPPRGSRRIVALAGEGGAGGGGPHPDLVAHEALGLAQTTTIALHGRSNAHLLRWNTGNTLGLYAGKWARIGHGTILGRWGELGTVFSVMGAGGTTSAWARGTVRLHIRQIAAFGAQPVVTLELEGGASIAAADFVALVTSVADPTTYELYARVTRGHEWLSFRQHDFNVHRTQHIWDSCSPFITTIPAGTQYVGVAA